MRLAVTLLVLLAGPAFADKKPRKLEPFRSEAGKFRVKLADDDPKESETTVATPAGPVAVSTWRTEAGRDLVLAVTVADYPEAFAAAGADKVLAGVRDGLKGVDGQLTADAPLPAAAAAGLPAGREFTVSAGRNVVRCRAYLVGRRLYQVMATGTKDAVAGMTADEFFGSFEVLR